MAVVEGTSGKGKVVQPPAKEKLATPGGKPVGQKPLTTPPGLIGQQPPSSPKPGGEVGADPNEQAKALRLQAEEANRLAAEARRNAKMASDAAAEQLKIEAQAREKEIAARFGQAMAITKGSADEAQEAENKEQAAAAKLPMQQSGTPTQTFTFPENPIEVVPDSGFEYNPDPTTVALEKAAAERESLAQYTNQQFIDARDQMDAYGLGWLADMLGMPKPVQSLPLTGPKYSNQPALQPYLPTPPLATPTPQTSLPGGIGGAAMISPGPVTNAAQNAAMFLYGLMFPQQPGPAAPPVAPAQLPPQFQGATLGAGAQQIPQIGPGGMTREQALAMVFPGQSSPPTPAQYAQARGAGMSPAQMQQANQIFQAANMPPVVPQPFVPQMFGPPAPPAVAPPDLNSLAVLAGPAAPQPGQAALAAQGVAPDQAAAAPVAGAQSSTPAQEQTQFDWAAYGYTPAEGDQIAQDFFNKFGFWPWQGNFEDNLALYYGSQAMASQYPPDDGGGGGWGYGGGGGWGGGWGGGGGSWGYSEKNPTPPFWWPNMARGI